MKGYCAGPMTGYPLYNWPMFEWVVAEYRANGWEMVSPTEIDESVDWAVHVKRAHDGSVISVELQDTFDYDRMLALDFEELRTCSAIVLLPEWQHSNGAKLELAEALRLGLEVRLA